MGSCKKNTFPVELNKRKFTIYETGDTYEPEYLKLIKRSKTYLEEDTSCSEKTPNKIAARLLKFALQKEMDDKELGKFIQQPASDTLGNLIKSLMARSMREKLRYQVERKEDIYFKYLALNKALKVLFKAYSLKLVEADDTESCS